MKRFIIKYAIWILIGISIFSRLPQLFSDYLILDGDECIVGLMAKHIYEGKEFPIYFWGQAYGFTLIETLFINVFYFVFGVNDIAVKLAMLCLWTAGVVLLYKTLKQLNTNTSFTPFFICLVFIFAPAWAVWSMKARGGYVSAFVLSNLCLYMILHRSKFRSIPSYVVLGLLFVLIYECQALWLPGLMPFLIFHFYKEKKIGAFLFFGLGVLLTAFMFYFIKHNSSGFWAVPAGGFTSELIEALKRMPEQVFLNMTGSYYLGSIIEINMANDFLALCFMFLIFIAPLFFFYFIVKKKPATFFYVSVLSTIFCLLTLLMMPKYTPRYLLPLLGFAMVMISDLLRRIENSKMISLVFYTPLIGLGIYALFSFKEYRYEAQNRGTIKGLSEFLIKKNIKAVFCRGPLLQWQIDFYSNESVIARYSAPIDRYQSYIKKVNTDYNAQVPTALVDFYYFDPFEGNENKILVEGNYIVRTKFSREDLLKEGFEISRD